MIFHYFTFVRLRIRRRAEVANKNQSKSIHSRIKIFTFPVHITTNLRLTILKNTEQILIIKIQKVDESTSEKNPTRKFEESNKLYPELWNTTIGRLNVVNKMEIEAQLSNKWPNYTFAIRNCSRSKWTGIGDHAESQLTHTVGYTSCHDIANAEWHN